MKIAVFGGSFDPPHTGHMQIANSVLEMGLADEVWLVPCFRHAFDKKMSSSKDRKAMLQMIAFGKIKVDGYELEQDGVSYTIDTLNYYSSKYPEHKFCLIIGSDQIKCFDKWKNYKEIIDKYNIFVYPREGYPYENKFSEMIFLENMKIVPVSSTEIRKRIKLSESVDDMLHPDILSYILRNNLYKDADKQS